MMLYYQTKFGCKPTSNLDDTAEIIIFWLYSPHCDLDIEHSKHFFSGWHSGLWCSITIPGLETKCSVVQKISSGQTFINISNLHCDLDLECSNPIFPQDTPAYDAVLSNQVWLQTDQQFRRYNKTSHTFIIQALAMTLTLKIVNQYFCMAHCLMIIHHHTKLGKIKKKWLSGSEDTEQTRLDTQKKYHQDKKSLTFWTFAVALTLNAVIQFFNRTLWLMMLCYQAKSGYKPTSSLEDTIDIVIFWLYKPLLWPWHWSQSTNFFLHDTLAYDAALQYQVW